MRIPVVALRVLRVGDDAVRRGGDSCRPEPADIRHVIPGVHVNQPDVLCREHARVIVAMPREPLVGRARVDAGSRRSAVFAVGVVAGQGTAYEAAPLPQRGHAAQVVGVG
ncbi:MAG TPA: hypothetical protein VF434_05095, partial [Promineifilum sp.]